MLRNLSLVSGHSLSLIPSSFPVWVFLPTVITWCFLSVSCYLNQEFERTGVRTAWIIINWRRTCKSMQRKQSPPNSEGLSRSSIHTHRLKPFTVSRVGDEASVFLMNSSLLILRMPQRCLLASWCFKHWAPHTSHTHRTTTTTRRDKRPCSCCWAAGLELNAAYLPISITSCLWLWSCRTHSPVYIITLTFIRFVDTYQNLTIANRNLTVT